MDEKKRSLDDLQGPSTCAVQRQTIKQRLEQDRTYLITRLAKVEETLQAIESAERYPGGAALVEKLESVFC